LTVGLQRRNLAFILNVSAKIKPPGGSQRVWTLFRGVTEDPGGGSFDLVDSVIAVPVHPTLQDRRKVILNRSKVGGVGRI